MVNEKRMEGSEREWKKWRVMKWDKGELKKKKGIKGSVKQWKRSSVNEKKMKRMKRMKWNKGRVKKNEKNEGGWKSRNGVKGK